jgi:hypothetical protein
MVVGGVLVVVAVIVVIVVLVTGGGGGGTPTGFSAANPGQSSKVTGANGKALSEISTYRAAVQGCGSQTTCIEKADRTLGDQLHLYANYVGTLKQAGGASKVVSNALNTAQVTANTFEILGDAQPTAANYRQVLHNFNVQSQLDKLTSAINALGAAASA